MTEQDQRRLYQEEFDDVAQEAASLAAQVTDLIPRGTKALLGPDMEMAEYIIAGDDEFDVRCSELEQRVFTLFALHGPMGRDLRYLTAAARIIPEVERSADLVKNIAKASRRIYGHTIGGDVTRLVTLMSEEARRIWKLTVDAMVERDAPLAHALEDIDDNLDRLQEDLIRAIFAAHNRGEIDVAAAVQLALVARFYERLGDHAVNIGVRVAFAVTGEPVEYTRRHTDAASPDASAQGPAA